MGNRFLVIAPSSPLRGINPSSLLPRSAQFTTCSGRRPFLRLIVEQGFLEGKASLSLSAGHWVMLPGDFCRRKSPNSLKHTPPHTNRLIDQFSNKSLQDPINFAMNTVQLQLCSAGIRWVSPRKLSSACRKFYILFSIPVTLLSQCGPWAHLGSPHPVTLLAAVTQRVGE